MIFELDIIFDLKGQEFELILKNYFIILFF